MDMTDTLSSIKSTLRRVLPENGTAILYGSRARGTANSQSDWDVLILLDKEDLEMSDYKNVSYPLTALGCELGETISPMLYTKSSWANNSFTPFYKNVEKEGITL